MGSVKNFEEVELSELNPYSKNSRKHSKSQIEQIANSIKEFGFINPILIDKDHNIIAGHGRVMGAQKLGLEKVPCLYVEGLSKKQQRAYIIADNKLAENSSWDEDILSKELKDLFDDDFDISITGFDNLLDDEDEEEDLDKENERLRTDRAYNLDILDKEEVSGFYEMPVIESNGYIPEELIGFNYAKTSDNKKAGIHFYLDDYQFERIWNDPKAYVELLSGYACVLSPDFSLYLDMPLAMKIWNVFRSRAIGRYLQSEGIKVIPTVSWAEPKTFAFAFEGIPKGSIVSISTIGVKQDENAMKIWKDGMDEMIKRIQPSAILVYGGKLDYDYGNIEVRYYENKVTEGMKQKGG